MRQRAVPDLIGKHKEQAAGILRRRRRLQIHLDGNHIRTQADGHLLDGGGFAATPRAEEQERGARFRRCRQFAFKRQEEIAPSLEHLARGGKRRTRDVHVGDDFARAQRLKFAAQDLLPCFERAPKASCDSAIATQCETFADALRLLDGGAQLRLFVVERIAFQRGLRVLGNIAEGR